MNQIDKYLNNFVGELQHFSIGGIDKLSNNERLLYLYAYYHYFNADSSKILEIIQGNVYHKYAEDHITGVYVDQESDYEDVDAIIALYIDIEEKVDFTFFLKYYKIAEMAIAAALNKERPREKLAEIFSEEDKRVSKTRPLKIRIITNYNPKYAKDRKLIEDAIQAIKPNQEYISYHIFFGMDLEHEIMEIEDPKEYVDTGVLKIDSPKNMAKYGNEESLLINASAKSINELYQQYGYRGLFAQNLRYYVKNTKVDTKIVKSIMEQSDNFWYYNNGLIIICDDYIIEDDVVMLQKFSIVNGGQTTRLIGETEFEKDFFVQCKIIKNKYNNEEEKIEFIANIAEASNTQKPIKDKDLIANRPEQRLLKKQLAEARIYCQIKRGEKINKKLYPNAWQNTTNEELGQFILSFVYQKPGTARNQKASICGNLERYNLIYQKKYNSEFLGDLLKIKAYYKLWLASLKKAEIGDSYKDGLTKYGMFVTTALIGTIAKIIYRPELISNITSSVMTEQKMEYLAQHDISHRIFKREIEDKRIFFALFEYCYSKFFRPGYEFLKTFKERYNQFSNFTKTDNNYFTYIIKQVEFEYRNGIPSADMSLLESVFYIPTEEEKEENSRLLKKYVNVLFSDVGKAKDISDDMISIIKDALMDYRTKTFKRKGIKAYEVFTNKVCDKLSKCAPTSLEELRELRCLDERQFDLYGNDIVEIIRSFIL